MIPNSISATALSVAMKCMTRYEAEHLHRGKSQQGTAAALGTVVHAALEVFITLVYLDKTHQNTEKLLVSLYEIQFLNIIGIRDKSDQDFKDGLMMMHNWFARADLEQPGRYVVSSEQKLSFPIKIAGTELPFNYIIDRLDAYTDRPGVYRVVDYKSNRWGINPDDLRSKPQAKAYALAVQIQFPDAKEIWVEFDMLRHDGPVGTKFTREDNMDTWREFKKVFKMIGDTPEGSAPETLNEECTFCVRKGTCGALRRNALVGGVAGKSLPALVEIRARLDYQRSGITSALAEVDNLLLAAAKGMDTKDLDSDNFAAEVTMSNNRHVDSERVEHLLGPDLWGKYGSQSITMGTIDALLKGTELDPQKKAQLKGLIYRTKGEPRIKSKLKK